MSVGLLYQALLRICQGLFIPAFVPYTQDCCQWDYQHFSFSQGTYAQHARFTLHAVSGFESSISLPASSARLSQQSCRKQSALCASIKVGFALACVWLQFTRVWPAVGQACATSLTLRGTLEPKLSPPTPVATATKTRSTTAGTTSTSGAWQY